MERNRKCKRIPALGPGFLISGIIMACWPKWGQYSPQGLQSKTLSFIGTSNGKGLPGGPRSRIAGE